MATIPIGWSNFDDMNWSFAGSTTAPGGGAANMQINWADIIARSEGRGTSLVIDGISMAIKIAAGGQWTLVVNGETNSYLYIASGTIGAGAYDWRSYFPLNLRLRPGSGAMIAFVATFAAADFVSLGAWGHYRATAEEPQIQPVSVEEFHFRLPKKKEGPI